MAIDIKTLNTNLPNSQKISELNEFILANEGGIEKGKFDSNEITEIYSQLSLSRKFNRNQSVGNSLATYSGWSSEFQKTGYDIFKFTPTDYAFSVLNNLYLDDKVLSNEGLALSESATTYDYVFVYDDDSGGGFTDVSSEAGSEGGTEFILMEDVGDYLYVGLSTTYGGIRLEFEQRGSNYTNTISYYNASSGSGWQALTVNDNNLVDNTSNFESDGNITYDIPDDWATVAVNSQTKYWIRISTSTVPVTDAKAYYIIPANNVPGLLAMSSSEVQDEAWKWCSFGSSIYVTIRNAGNTSFEGDFYITSASSAANLQNFFIYNHVYTLDAESDAYDPLVTKISDYSATVTDGIILADTTSASIIITLPSAVGIEGKRFIIKCITLDSGRTCSIDTQSGEYIDGISSSSFAEANDSMILVSDGANYRKIGFISSGAGSGDMTKCYDKKTEILTLEGFKKISQVTKDDIVCTLNPENNEIVYQKVKNTFVYDDIKEMYHIKNQQIDLLVTPNHKMFVRRRYKENFELIEAKDIFGKQVEYKKDGIWIGNRKDFVLPSLMINGKLNEKITIPMILWVEFMGYFLSEGSTYKNKTSSNSFDYKTIITQRKHKDKMFSCVKKIAKKINKKAYVSNDNIIISSKQLFIYMSKFGKSYEKYVHKEIKNSNSKMIKVFLNSYILGDGNERSFLNKPTISKVIYTSSKRMVDDLQELCLKVGWGSNNSINCKKGRINVIEGRTVIAKHNCYSIYINQTKLTPSVNHGQVKKQNAQSEGYEEYNDKVYCIEVENFHILFVRRNGKTVWSGNSVYDTDNDGIVDASESIDDNAGNTATASDIKDAVTKKHTRSHAIDGSSDHTSTITENNLMDADANGLPDDSGLSVTDMSSAISLKHSQNTDTDLDATFESTFMKKTDSINSLNDVDFDSGTPADNQVLTYDSGGGTWKSENPAASGAEWRFIDIPAGAWDYPTSNPAPLENDTGTNGIIKRHLFDDTTEEFIIAQVRLPFDLDASGTVHIEVYGYAVTAVGSKNIELKFYHSAKTDGEDWDAAYSSKESGDLATDGTQDQLDSFSWSETVSNLGWVADDFVRIKVSRIAPSSDNLSGDWSPIHVRLKLPRV